MNAAKAARRFATILVLGVGELAWMFHYRMKQPTRRGPAMKAVETFLKVGAVVTVTVFVAIWALALAAKVD